MRWKYPISGDRRTRTWFALWPVGWGGTWYWLEYVQTIEVYEVYPMGNAEWHIETFKALKDETPQRKGE